MHKKTENYGAADTIRTWHSYSLLAGCIERVIPHATGINVGSTSYDGGRHWTVSVHGCHSGDVQALSDLLGTGQPRRGDTDSGPYYVWESDGLTVVAHCPLRTEGRP